jgi:hypothetical protein
MKLGFDNKAISSFFLWFNHIILKKGEAYQTGGTLFYPINQTYNGLYTYASPFSQFVSDSSVTGATIPTGVYLNNSFVPTGVSGLVAIDYERGRCYFSSQQTARVSGNVSWKEFNVVLNSEPEQTILFETQYQKRPKIGQSPTGLQNNEVTYPIIFIQHVGGTNDPFAFGGQDESKIEMGAIVLADSEANLTAVCSLFKDHEKTVIPFFIETDYPYNVFGAFKSGVYNYTALASGKNHMFVDNVSVSKVNSALYSQVRAVNPKVFLGIIDFELSMVRYPRLE